MFFRLILLVFLIQSSLCLAQESSWQDQLQSWSSRIFGLQLTTKFFGHKKSTIMLPELPTLTHDGRKMNQCELYKSKTMEISSELRKKADALFLQELYEEIRSQKPNAQEYSSWMNTLEQGASREGIYRALVLDGTYRSFEYYLKRSPKKEVFDYTVTFMKRFIGEEVDLDSLQSLSFHSIKRIIVEKTLAMMDLLCHEEEDLYAWYAVFSADLATHWSSLWLNSTRKNTSVDYHYKWAKAVDEQILKSEVVIKLHRLYNFLQR